MNIERNKEVMDVLAMMAEVKKKFHSFAQQFNDEGMEDMEDMCTKVSHAMNAAIIELTTLDNYIFTNDVVNWTEGETVSTIDQAKA